MIAVYKKELRVLFSGLMGYGMIAFYLLFAGVFVTMNNLFGQNPSLESTYSYLLFALIMIIPVLTMRALAEERQSGSFLLLSSLPIRTSDYVLGKYFALLTQLAIPMGIVGSYTFILSLYGPVRPLPALLATLVLFLVAAAMVAIGLFISSLTTSSIFSAVITLAVLLLIYYLPGLAVLLPATTMGSFLLYTLLLLTIGALIGYFMKSWNWGLLSVALLEGGLVAVLLLAPAKLEGSAALLFTLLSITDRFEIFSLYGIFDLTAVIYYLSVAFLFVFFTVASMEKKRWN